MLQCSIPRVPDIRPYSFKSRAMRAPMGSSSTSRLFRMCRPNTAANYAATDSATERTTATRLERKASMARR